MRCSPPDWIAQAANPADPEPVAGRLQQLNLPGKPLVVVDYAHAGRA